MLEEWLKKPIFATAFTHRSYLNESKEQVESNERLEFLGDAILSFVISKFLYLKRNSDPEGELTNLRSFIVKTDSLAKAAIKLDLGSRLRMSKGEEMTGGRSNDQLLANTYEALLGAIFLSEGLEEAQKFIEKTLLPFFESELELGAPKDAKSKLQELVQEKLKQSPKYKIIKTIGPDHAKRFTVGVFLDSKQLSEGEGLSKQEAEEVAAEKALKTFNT